MPLRTLAAVSFVAIPPVPSDDPAPDDVDTCQRNVQHAARATVQHGSAESRTVRRDRASGAGGTGVLGGCLLTVLVRLSSAGGRKGGL